VVAATTGATAVVDAAVVDAVVDAAVVGDDIL